MEIEAGPTAYNSEQDPRLLTEAEQAVLVFAACGITDPALADWSYAADAGGDMMARFVGQTVSSPDAVQTMAMVVIDGPLLRFAEIAVPPYGLLYMEFA